MSDATPLGRLLRERRQTNRVSWKRLEKATGLEDQTMMRWERGVTKDPPLSKVLLYAREVGISLEELAAAVLPNGAQVDTRGDAKRIADSGEAIAARPVGRAARGQQKRRRAS